MTDTLLYTLRFLFAGALIVASLFLFSFLLASTDADKAQAKQTASPSSTKIMDDNSPNVITSGAAKTVNGLVRTMDSAGYAISGGIQSAASTVAQVGRSVASGVQTGTVAAVRGVGSGFASAGRAVGAGVGSVGRAVGSGVSFVVSIPGNVLGFVSNTAVVNAFIRPSDHEEVPIIDPNSAELRTAIAALPPAEDANQTAPQSAQGPQWPMHGRVTTEFGVDHWPFQHTHTGIDISNGRGSDVRPFRPGRVIDTVHSSRGLGNHVIVDHGNGVTSVYAHLASIAVSVGQDVGLDATLGSEGTTGVSTGNHLHFEIRVHGQAANPRQFISGQP